MTRIPRVYIKDGRYYYVQDLEERSPTTGRPKQKWHALTRVDEGEAALHAALAVFFSEKPTKNMGVLIQEFLKAHLPSLVFSSRKEYERVFEMVAKAFVEFDADEVLPGDVMDFLSQFEGSPVARNHYKSKLSTFFSWCVLHSHIPVNPCREIRISKPPKRTGRLNGLKFWAIYDALPPIGQCFMMLTFLTRQRPTEIRLLQEKHIGPTYITFKPTKTERSSGEQVEVLITPQIQTELDRARKLAKVKGMPGSSAFIIQTTGGTAFTRQGLKSMWVRGRDKAGCPDVTTRDIRPYALKAMEAQGYDLKAIQLSAAHTKRGQTEDYLNQYRDRVSDAVILPPKREKT